MSLRVIAGSARGRKLKPVPGDSTRPIMDRVKEALFSIIGSDIRGAHVLDLFAGTGSVGIEALSRGAELVLFIDRDRRAIKTIYDNLVHTGLSAGARVSRRDAFQVLAGTPERTYDFIFVAPPQYKAIWRRTLETLDSSAAWQSPCCRVIVQIDPSEYDPQGVFQHLDLVDQRKYGRTMLLIYQFSEDALAAPDGSAVEEN